MKLNEKTTVKVLVASVLLAIPLFITGCLNNETPEVIDYSYVCIYHFSPDAGDLDIYDNDEKINNGGYKYGTYSFYTPFTEGVHNIKFTVANSQDLLTSELIDLDLNTYYSLFVVNEANFMESVFGLDTLEQPESGKAMIRFINASPDASQLVDLAIVDSDTLFENRFYGLPSGFIQRNAGTFDFVVNDSDADTAMITLQDAKLEGGRFYTIALQGYKNPPEDNDNDLELRLIAK